MPGSGRRGARLREGTATPRQLALWDSQLGSLPLATLPAPPPLLVARPDRDGQRPLFEDRIQLLGEIEAAFDEADCDGLTRAVATLRATYGEAAVPEDIRDWLGNALPPGFWERFEPPEARLGALGRALLGLGAGRASRFRAAFLARLLERQRPAEIVAVDPASLPALFAVLSVRGHREEARRLVLEALLEGRDFDSHDFARAGDEELAELLSENRAPEWLASLGVLRGLWLPPRVERHGAEELEREIDAPTPRGDRARALAFWRCLTALYNRARLSDTLESRAKIKMRRLDRELHAAIVI